MAKVLVVEDEGDVRELLMLHLKREGYSVRDFDNAEEALETFAEEKYDLVILDWMLPSMSGLDICKVIRTRLHSLVPIMLLTARADTMDKVIGLEIGADDYLTKPFEVREFVARVRALLRRAANPSTDMNSAEAKAVGSANAKTGDRPVVLGPFKLDFAAKQIFLENQEIQLTPNEYKLLSTLMNAPGTTYERGDLIKLIQGPGVAVVDRTIDTTVLGLRKKLGKSAEWVETVRGFGYRFRKA